MVTGQAVFGGGISTVQCGNAQQGARSREGVTKCDPHLVCQHIIQLEDQKQVAELAAGAQRSSHYAHPVLNVLFGEFADDTDKCSIFIFQPLIV